MADAYSGLAPGSLSARLVIAGAEDSPIDLSSRFAPVADGVFEAELDEPLRSAPEGSTLVVEVADAQGNVSRAERRFSVKLRIGDVSGDGAVSALDLARLLSSWGGVDADCDLNGDGVVNAVDLALLLSDWGG